MCFLSNNYLQPYRDNIIIKTYFNTVNANSKTTFGACQMIVKYSCKANITHFSHTISCFFPCNRFVYRTN